MKVSENGVLPEEIESGKYVVDLDYYRENQLIPPLKRILEKICNDPRSLFMFHRVCKPKVTGVFASWVKKEEDEPSYEAQKQRVTKKTKKKLLKWGFFLFLIMSLYSYPTLVDTRLIHLFYIVV